MSGRWRLCCGVGCGILVLSAFAGSTPGSQSIIVADHWMTQGAVAFQQGQFEQAIEHWRQANDLYATSNQRTPQLEALLSLADAYQALGQPYPALQVLELAKTLAESAADKDRLAAILGSLGKTYWMAGTLDKARTYLETSISLARQVGNTHTAATNVNHVGNLLFTQKNYRAANARYQESLILARQSRDQSLVASVLTNMAKIALQEQDDRQAELLLKEALQQTQALNDSHDKAYGLIVLGQLYRRFPPAKDQGHRLACQLFTAAASIATTLNDQRTQSFAWGYLGQLYEQEQRYPEALQLTRRAVFAAQQSQAPELLYLWQWQLGRLLKIQGDTASAISVYQQAITQIQAIRPALSLNAAQRGLSFREAAGDAFLELAELLLQRASQASDPRQREHELSAVRDTVEQLKTAELKDYFQDECVTALQSRITLLDRPGPQTAVLYPILFSDRTVWLVSLPEGLQSVTVTIDRDHLARLVGEFRRFLEKRTNLDYLPLAQRLYGLLIAPVEKEAKLREQRIDTLIIVPDGFLYTIPLAALHDGHQFLIERYAVATIPGLTLIDFHPFPHYNRVLLAGLTKSVQGVQGLKYVGDELDIIHKSYGGKVLKDEAFRLANLRQELTSASYSIVHIASHGHFASVAGNTFLLTFDDKLTPDQLERFMALGQYREQPVELLTLSACQTAVGDKRAALGLAGIAVKAGARSAVATLWSTQDQTAFLLITKFYDKLLTSGLSKAKALQQAQLARLADSRYDHPGYWAPFLLIGNWL